MNVSVQVILGRVMVHEPHKGLESPVGQCGRVAQAVSGSMGHQDVEAAAGGDFRPEADRPYVHLAVRILEGARFIAHGTAETKEADALIGKNLVVDADAALRRLF